MGCILCESLEWGVFLQAGNRLPYIRIVRCRGCGLLYVSPRPNSNALESLYANYEIPSQWDSGSRFFNESVISIITRVVKPGKRILEVGCSYGKILDRLASKGYRVQGVEASASACQHIRQTYDFPVYEGFVETFLDSIKGQETFDGIIALNLIEHLRDPYETLKMWNNVLNPKGYILIVVPDIALALLIGKIKKLLGKADPYGLDSGDDRGAVAFNSPGHLYFFSRKTLAILCQRLGWEIVEHRHAPYVLSGGQAPTSKDRLKPILYYSVRFLEKLRLGPMGLSYSQLLLARKSS